MIAAEWIAILVGTYAGVVIAFEALVMGMGARQAARGVQRTQEVADHRDRRTWEGQRPPHDRHQGEAEQQEKHGGDGDCNYWGISSRRYRRKASWSLAKSAGPPSFRFTPVPSLIKLTVCWMLEYHQPISQLPGIQRAAS